MFIDPQEFLKFSREAVPKIREKMEMHDKKGKIKPEWRNVSRIELDKFLHFIFTQGEPFWRNDEKLDRVIALYHDYRIKIWKINKESKTTPKARQAMSEMVWQGLDF